jgi:hypothetical protein
MSDDGSPSGGASRGPSGGLSEGSDEGSGGLSDDGSEGGSEGEEEEEEVEEVEEEPLLKYRRVKAGVVRILTGGAFTPDGGERASSGGGGGGGGSGGSASSSPALSSSSTSSASSRLRPPDAATCVVLHETCMVLGTQSGAVYVLDHVGNEISRHGVHTARVNDVGIDATGTRIVSCGDDGKVVVYSAPGKGSAAANGSGGREGEQQLDPSRIGGGGAWSAKGDASSQVTSYGRPMLSAALDPAIVGKRERVLISGCVDGRLRVNNRGWFRSSDTILHEGEGPVHLVRWEGSLVAWANDYGIKLYDNVNHQRISYIERPRPRMESTRAFDVRACRCRMFWEVPEKILLVGWGDCWMVVQISTRTVTANPTPGASFVESQDIQAQVRCAEIIALHYTQDYVISGICAFGEDIALLAYVPPEELHEEESSDEDDYMITVNDAAAIQRANLVGGAGAGAASSMPALPSARMRPSRPELRIVDRQTGDQLSCDMLPVYGFARCGPNDYNLESDRAHSAVSRQRQLQHDRRHPNMEVDALPSMYIVSPKDVVVASPRTVDDHIKWALEHDQYDQALMIAEHAEPPLSRDRMQNLAERYLAHLVHDGEFEQAAALCPRLLQADKEMWSRWVLVFAEHSELLLIGPHVPTATGCRLPPSTYEMILAAFLDETMAGDATKGGDQRIALSFLDLIVQWLPDATVGSPSSFASSSSSGNSSASFPNSVLDPTSSGPSSAAATTKARNAPLFDLGTIIRKLEQILQDLAFVASHMSGASSTTASNTTTNNNNSINKGSGARSHVTKPLLHLALAQMYTTLGQYGKAIEEYLNSSLLMLGAEGGDRGGTKPGSKGSTTSSFAVGAEAVDANGDITQTANKTASAAANLKEKQHRLLSRRLRVFDLIRTHKLYNVIMAGGGGRIAGLLRLDGKRALELFVDAPQHMTTRSTGGGGSATGVGGGGGSGAAPGENGDGGGMMGGNTGMSLKRKSGNGGSHLSVQTIAQELRSHPKLQLRYLDGIWQHPRAKSGYNSNAYSDLHELQIELYARLQPQDLLAFLKSSEHYDLRRAYEVCQNCDPPMYQEMVYILSRLGNTKEALALIIEELEDVKQAIEFIKDSHDASLWADLVDRSLKSPRFIAG